MKAGLTVQRVTCSYMRAGLAVRRELCTSSQLAWTCKVSFARSRCREIQSIDRLVPKIWYHVPRASNDQNISQTTFFQEQKRPFSEWGSASRFCVAAHHHSWRRRVCSGAMKAGLTVQRVLCTSSQLAWTCRDSCARLLSKADRAQGLLSNSE